MKFFKWLKEELVENIGVLLLALVLSAVTVIFFNVML